MSALLKLFLLFALLFPGNGKAQGNLELEVGRTSYAQIDGVWFDTLSGPYSNAMHPLSWSIAMRVPGWRAGFTWLGAVSTNAGWGQYEHRDEIANPRLSRSTIYVGHGRGEVAGLWIGKTIGWNVKQVRLDFEGGPFLYYRHWLEDWHELCGPLGGSDETNSINATVYGAATLRYRWLIVEQRFYGRILNGMVGGAARQTLIGISMPLWL